jgi:flagellar hook-associated protein 2
MPLGSISIGSGATTGFDFQAMIDAIMRAERQPIRQLESKINAFQKTKSSFNELRELLNGFTETLQDLDSDDTFAARKTALSQEDAPFSVNANSSAAPGTYDIEVTQLAQAHRVRSETMTDQNSPVVSDGTITVQAGGHEEITVDVSAAAGNNSLRAIADAINEADEGVNASIVNDGTGSILVLRSAESGTAHGMTISDTTNLGLAAAENELQAAQNAAATVDGIAITSQSNQISRAIAGVTLNLTGTTESPVTLTVEEDTETAKKAIEDFVEAYNKVNTYFDEQFGSAAFRAASSVAGSSLVRSIQTNLQAMITGTVSGIPEGKLDSLAEIGVVVADGTGRLELDGAYFDKLVESGRFEEIEAVLRSSGSTTDPSIVFDSASTKTQAGDYAVTVTQAAHRADVSGSTVVSDAGIAQDENLTIGINGSNTTVALTTGDTLADIVTKVNTALEAAGMEGRAYDLDGQLHIRASAYGDEYTVTAVSDVAASTTSSGIGTTQLSDTGVDVQGTIGGVAAGGNGQYLIGADDTDMDGLIVRVYATDDSVTAKGGDFGTVGYSRGLMDRITEQIDRMTDTTDGLIKSALDGYDDSIEAAENRIEAIERRLAQRQELLVRQFSAAERAISTLQAMQAQLNASL